MIMVNESFYVNGNYYVHLNNSTGTKTYRGLRRGEKFISKFPDSIDLKITNRCSIGCPFCHESSVKTGNSFNLERTKKVLSSLPKVGIELAIGGGDVLESSVIKDCSKLCNWATTNYFFPRLTINSKSIDTEEKIEILRENFPSTIPLGVSIDHYDEDFIKFLEDSLRYDSIIVYHIIAGLFPLEDIDKLISPHSSILVLGYKNWGRAVGIPPKYDLTEWGKKLKRVMYNRRPSNYGCIIGFDNLAIEQLGIKECIGEKAWNNLYMGDEFSHTMYVDAVSEIFAPTSRDSFRVPWSEMDILEFFNKYKKE